MLLIFRWTCKKETHDELEKAKSHTPTQKKVRTVWKIPLCSHRISLSAPRFRLAFAALREGASSILLFNIKVKILSNGFRGLQKTVGTVPETVEDTVRTLLSGCPEAIIGVSQCQSEIVACPRLLPAVPVRLASEVTLLLIKIPRCCRKRRHKPPTNTTTWCTKRRQKPQPKFMPH